jgi:hypothetical protein
MEYFTETIYISEKDIPTQLFIHFFFFFQRKLSNAICF